MGKPMQNSEEGECVQCAEVMKSSLPISLFADCVTLFVCENPKCPNYSLVQYPIK